MAHAFVEARRSYTGLLTGIERRVLVWMAERMPRAVNSDHLTVLALVSMFFVGLSFAVSSRYPLALVTVVGFLALNWFGDSLDGTLARVRNQQRPRYGFYVDHILDAFGVLFVFGGLAVSGHMTPIVAAGFLVAYYILAIEVYLATYCLGTFRMSFWGCGPTELRILLAGGALALLVKPVVTMAGVSLRLFDAGGVAAIAGLLLTAIVSIASNTRALYQAEPVPDR
jgi:phosphatidylglycerophosphate synthase